MKAKLILTGLAMIMALTTVSAQAGRGGNGCQKRGCRGYAYVDSNSNGICDRYERRMAFRDSRIDGRNGYGSGNRRGDCRNFVDANKNGICDYYESQPKRKQQN